MRSLWLVTRFIRNSLDSFRAAYKRGASCEIYDVPVVENTDAPLSQGPNSRCVVVVVAAADDDDVVVV